MPKLLVWTPRAVEVLTETWAATFSVDSVVDALNEKVGLGAYCFVRSSVMSKMHEMRRRGADLPYSTGRRDAVGSAPVRSPPPVAAPIPASVAQTSVGVVTVEYPEKGGCHWPLWGNAPLRSGQVMRFCCAPVDRPGGVYCAPHQAEGTKTKDYQPPPERVLATMPLYPVRPKPHRLPLAMD